MEVEQSIIYKIEDFGAVGFKSLLLKKHNNGSFLNVL